jgi:hypothetical protein
MCESEEDREPGDDLVTGGHGFHRKNIRKRIQYSEPEAIIRDEHDVIPTFNGIIVRLRGDIAGIELEVRGPARTRNGRRRLIRSVAVRRLLIGGTKRGRSFPYSRVRNVSLGEVVLGGLDFDNDGFADLFNGCPAAFRNNLDSRRCS